jgi:diadenosine tetraphosphate (Ap4A) HIT family hydrolase
MAMDCVFCDSLGGELLWQDDFCRVVLVEDENYIGFCRVILNQHVKEMTDLTSEERARIMNVTFFVEAVLREVLQPEKINLASLGNKTPHLHWHVIPRFKTDIHFPETIWSAAQRASKPTKIDQLKELLMSKIAQGMSTNSA